MLTQFSAKAAAMSNLIPSNYRFALRFGVILLTVRFARFAASLWYRHCETHSLKERRKKNARSPAALVGTRNRSFVHQPYTLREIQKKWIKRRINTVLQTGYRSARAAVQSFWSSFHSLNFTSRESRCRRKKKTRISVNSVSGWICINILFFARSRWWK